VAKELFENMDYATYRRYYQMHIVVDTPPPAPCWPDDLVLKPFDPECDLEAVYLADIDCSKDHHGYIEESWLFSSLQGLPHIWGFGTISKKQELGAEKWISDHETQYHFHWTFLK